MPGPLAKVRVLMLGNDAALLRTRSKVLGTIGCDTDVVSDEEQARQAIEATRRKPELVILCHSAEDECTDQVRRLAQRAGIPTYSVEKMVPPQQLIDDVRRVLKQEAGAQRRTTRA